MSETLRRAWRGEAKVTSAALMPLSWAYGAGAAMHRAMFSLGLKDQARARVPVISVGNLVAGGAGKTPVTLELARRFLAAGRRVGVLSRGYGRISSERVVVVSDGEEVLADAGRGGDEPVWLARKEPRLIVVTAPERIEGAREAEILGAEVLILDDGFSHHALARDVDVLVVDDELRFGNGRLLPAGPLREPLESISRASMAWLTRTTEKSSPPAEIAKLPLVRSGYRPETLVDFRLQPREPLTALRGRRVVAMCGIARPEGFFQTLAGLGAQLVMTRAFDDHHWFTSAEVEAVSTAAQALSCDFIVTTEKDAVRLPADAGERFRALSMSLEVLGDTSAIDDVVRKFAKRRAA